MALVCELRFERLARFLRQPDFQQLARRRRVVAANDHDASEEVVEGAACGRFNGGRTADHAAQEPARTVEAQEPDRLWRLVGAMLVPDGHPAVQLDARGAITLP